MKLERPIVFFDVETTGLDLANDRIIEIAMIKVSEENRDGISYVRRINPEGRVISPEATSKHGMKAEDLAHLPPFKEYAQEIYEFMEDCDIGGYNCKRFDIPILIEEFLRAGIAVSIKSFKIIDVYKILMKAEPRDLESTYRRFTGKTLENAHSAEADIIATMDILDAMEECFALPDTVEGMHEFTFADDDTVDLENKLKRVNGQILFNFGKYRGKTIQEVNMLDSSYYDWIINKSDMTRYTKSIFRNVVEILNRPKV